MAAQSGHLPWASLLRLEAASLHTEALDFAGAAAIAREELRGPSLTQAGRQRAMFELAFAHLGLGEFDEAYAAFTAPQLVAAAGIEAMPWSGQVLLRRGLGQLWLARGKLDRAHRDAEALHDLAAAAADPPLRASAARLLADEAAAGGERADFVYVFPEPLGPHRWRGVTRAGGLYRVYLIRSLTGEVRLVREERTALDDPRVAYARRSPLGRRLEHFFKAPVWSVEGPEADARVHVDDLRFRSILVDTGPVFAYTLPGVSPPVPSGSRPAP